MIYYELIFIVKLIYKNLKFKAENIFCFLVFNMIFFFIVTTSCGGEVGSNLTYVTNPDFPNLIDQPMNCSVVVKKIEPQVSQLRIDFLHFNIVRIF